MYYFNLENKFIEINISKVLKIGCLCNVMKVSFTHQRNKGRLGRIARRKGVDISFIMCILHSEPFSALIFQPFGKR